MSWPNKKEKKNHCFEASSSLILCKNNELFLDWTVICDEKWVLYDNRWQPAQWLAQEEAPKHFSKPNLHQKNLMVTVRWSAARLIHYVFLILIKPLLLRSMLSKSVRCTKNCNACSQHWPTEWSQFSMTTSDRMSLNQHFKSWMNWATKFYPIHHIHLISRQPTTTSLSTWTTFCRENASTTSRRQKLLSKSLSDPKARIFTLVE